MRGLCECGCGRTTTIAVQTNAARGDVRGQHVRFVMGHQHRKSPVDWLEEDRGFETPCHIWQLAINSAGYAIARHKGRVQTVIRIVCEKAYGALDRGTEPDHLCRVRECVNIEHLEVVTRAENLRRGRIARAA